MKYAIQNYKPEHMARVLGRDLSISTKQSIEMCNFIKKKKVKDAKKLLGKVMENKLAVPYKRFNKNIGHKPGIAAGRFPQKTTENMIKLLDEVETNAQNKGLNVDDLYIMHICAHKASAPWHYGRQRRRKMKRTHIEIVVEEKEDKKNTKREAPKEVSKEPKKEEKKKPVGEAKEIKK
ncbi:50S ribosomal protein L22 [archaeon]|nr:50S ribosomal protein L22 [archaeon]|tara:strand:+ start:2930 stop:3463 length:534 start_codon:yes stop_codon:yes gene_type:complete